MRSVPPGVSFLKYLRLTGVPKYRSIKRLSYERSCALGLKVFGYLCREAPAGTDAAYFICIPVKLIREKKRSGKDFRCLQ